MEDEKLPKCNPIQQCHDCGRQLPMWKLFKDSATGQVRIGHALCYSSKGGLIILLCSLCKSKEQNVSDINVGPYGLHGAEQQNAVAGQNKQWGG